MNEQESREMRENIRQGLNKSFERMVVEKKKTNSELAFADKEGIIKVKAEEIYQNINGIERSTE